MRFLLYFAGLMLAMLAAVALAHFYLSDAIEIRYGQWSASAPLWLAAGAFLVLGATLLIAMRLLLALLFLPAALAGWRSRRQKEKQARLRADALKWSVYGNRRNVLKHLSELAAIDEAAKYRAAVVAEELGDHKARDKFLRQAANAKDAVIAAAAKAKLSMQDNRPTEAANILASAGAPRAAVLLAQLQYEAARARGDMNAALVAATALREELPAVHGKLVTDTICHRLQNASGADAINQFWREQVAAADRKRPALLCEYLQALWRAGGEREAQAGLAQAIKQHSGDYDVLELGIKIGEREAREALFRANEKRVDTADSPRLLLLMGQLADSLELSGKGRLYRQKQAALEARQATR